MAEEENDQVTPGVEPDAGDPDGGGDGGATAARPSPLERVAPVVDGARRVLAEPDTRRFLAGALVGALVLWAGGVVFRGDDPESADARVEALRADVAELRADLAELRAGGADLGAATHSTESTESTAAAHESDDHETADTTAHEDGHDDAHTEDSAADAHSDEPPHWTYAESAEWGSLADEYIECLEGQEQSPIDLSSEWERVGSTSEFEYEPVPVTVTDNGHTVQVAAEGAGTVTQQHHEYSLVQFHFHAPSEHTIDGEHHAVEVHLVHKDADEKLAVVGVMIDEGEPLEDFDAILDAIGEPGEEQSAGEFDPSVLLPDDLTFFHYRGSLTTPPCTEGVAWRVMAEPITMSAAQIDELKSHFAEANNRPVQPRNDRDAHIDE